MRCGVTSEFRIMSLADQERNNINIGRSRPHNARPPQEDRASKLGTDRRPDAGDARTPQSTEELRRVERPE